MPKRTSFWWKGSVRSNRLARLTMSKGSTGVNPIHYIDCCYHNVLIEVGNNPAPLERGGRSGPAPIKPKEHYTRAGRILYACNCG